MFKDVYKLIKPRLFWEFFFNITFSNVNSQHVHTALKNHFKPLAVYVCMEVQEEKKEVFL